MKNQISEKKRVVIFVRNIIVTEALVDTLKTNKINATYVHSKVKDAMEKIRAFKNKQIEVLVVTRQMFGRGFDLPQADVAIFYSPKEDERVMWQEMLRIRSTRRNFKNVFILFYSWTSESAKIGRLIDRMLSNGAIPIDYGFLWTYHINKIFNGLQVLKEMNRGFFSKGKYKVNDKEKSTELFISKFIQNLKSFGLHKFGDTYEKLMDIANEIELSKFWPLYLVEELITDLAGSIDDLLERKDKGMQSLIHGLLMKTHPDRHQYRRDEASNDFWHSLTRNVNAFHRDIEI